MTSRISNRKKDGLVLLASLGESLIPPRIPINWVVRMLDQVGRFRVNQPVRMAWQIGEALRVFYVVTPIRLGLSRCFRTPSNQYRDCHG